MQQDDDDEEVDYYYEDNYLDDEYDLNSTEEYETAPNPDISKLTPAYLPVDRIKYNGNIVFSYVKVKRPKDKDDQCINDQIRECRMAYFADNPNCKEFFYLMYSQLQQLNSKRFPALKDEDIAGDGVLTMEERRKIGIPKYLSELFSEKEQLPNKLLEKVTMFPLDTGAKGLVFVTFNEHYPFEEVVNDDYDMQHLYKQVAPYVLAKYFASGLIKDAVVPVYQLMIDARFELMQFNLNKNDPRAMADAVERGIDLDSIPDHIEFLWPREAMNVISFVDTEVYKEIKNGSTVESNSSK